MYVWHKMPGYGTNESYALIRVLGLKVLGVNILVLALIADETIIV